MKYVRLFSYVLTIVCFWILTHQTTVIPITFGDGRKADIATENARIRQSNFRIPELIGFKETTKSGIDLARIAQSMADARGLRLSQYSEPKIRLVVDRGNLLWHLHYSILPYVPDGGFTIIIVDKTGDVSLHTDL